MASLAEELSKLTNPDPVFKDPEDGDEFSGAQLVGREELGENDVPQTSTKLRRQAARLLVEEDSRYAGKKTSRKRLREQEEIMIQDDEDEESNSGSEESEDLDEGEEGDGEDSEDEDDSEEEEQDEEDSDDDDSDEDLTSFKDKMKSTLPKSSTTEFSFDDDGDYSKFASDSEENDGSEDESEESGDSDESEEEEDEEGEEEEEGGISAFSKARLDEEVKKGEAVRIQLNVWDQLLKSRIELQKILVLVNRLPQEDSWNHFTNQGGKEYSTAIKEAQSAMKSVLDKVFLLQTDLLSQNTETKHLVDDQQKVTPETDKKAAKTVDDDDDEEITSDEDDISSEEMTPQKVTASAKSRKRKHGLTEYPGLLSKRHKVFAQYRDDTIQKWFDKTKVASGKLSRGFSAFEQSAVKQIKQVLSDRDRLIKRTQLRRSTYRVLGETECEKPEEEKAGEDEGNADIPPQPVGRESTKDYNLEIFDDDDFYHQLLRELIQRKTMDINDPIALSRQWLELQKLRSKVKKNVDTRASKGRKIRYHILPKLVNFMAPIDNSSWSDEARDDLYRSLFGKRGGAETGTATSS